MDKFNALERIFCSLSVILFKLNNNDNYEDDNNKKKNGDDNNNYSFQVAKKGQVAV